MEAEEQTLTNPYLTADVFAVPNAHHPIPLEGSIIILDPIEQYYKSLQLGEMPELKCLIIAKESCGVWCIMALVDNSQQVECVLNPGCQIIAMLEFTCHSLGLTHDLKIILQMQSANRNLDTSLGLSQNVLFCFNTIMVHLQIHIVQSLAYAVLLGWPFDVLTQSIVWNYLNKDQTITIHDLNSERIIVVLTLPHSIKHWNSEIEEQDF